MEIDYLGVKDKSKEEQDLKKAEFIAKLKEAIEKRENKEKLKNEKKGTRGTKVNK